MAKLRETTGKSMIASGKLTIPANGQKIYFKLLRASYVDADASMQKYTDATVHFVVRRDESGKPIVDENGNTIREPIPCMRAVCHDKCPICEKYWELYNSIKESGGTTLQNPQLEPFKPHNVYDVPVVTSDGRITTLSIPRSLRDELFGSYRGGKKTTGLIREMLNDPKPQDPYDLTSERGWLMAWRTGDSRDMKTIRYHVERAKIENDDGGMLPLKMHVPQFVLDFDDENLQDPRVQMRKRAWTMEEVEQYVAKGGKYYPSRLRAEVDDVDVDAVVKPKAKAKFAEVENDEDESEVKPKAASTKRRKLDELLNEDDEG